MSWLPDWLTGYDAQNAEAAAAADAQLRAINDKNGEKYGPEWAKRVADDYTRQDDQGLFSKNAGADDVVALQRGEVETEFEAGLKEGANNIIGKPLTFAGKIFKASFLAVPVWVWLLGIVAVFVYLGGGAWLVRKAKGRFAS